jgi:hypothetical protein
MQTAYRFEPENDGSGPTIADHDAEKRNGRVIH